MAQVVPSKAQDAWTIRRLVGWAAEDFRQRGFDSPRLDAELLLSKAIGLDRVGLVVQAERVLDSDELPRFRELVKRRRKAEPIAYILGQREFYGHVFKVDQRVLIPRPDTETLVDVALERTRSRSMYGRALDVCTGSGCVAIAFAKARNTWHVTAIDVSAEALELAAENAIRLGAIRNMRFLEGDLLKSLDSLDRYDLITANPPYIPSASVPELQRDIAAFEPTLALDGGVDGLDVVRAMISQAPAHLEPGGVLALEIGHDQRDRVIQLFAEAGFSNIETRRDYGGIDRVVSGVP